MNPEIKARWVAALRSGKYEQERAVLKGKSGFCCLGVLCEIYATDSGFTAWQSDDFSEEGEELPNQDVVRWAAFPHKYGDESEPCLNDLKVEIGGEYRNLADHNDGDQHAKPPRPPRTFAEIADAIESQL